MNKTNQDCEVVRELICLAFYAKNNLNSNNNFLGKYKFGEKEYEVFSSIKGSSSIFIKCENQSICFYNIDKNNLISIERNVIEGNEEIINFFK